MMLGFLLIKGASQNIKNEVLKNNCVLLFQNLSWYSSDNLYTLEMEIKEKGGKKLNYKNQTWNFLLHVVVNF